MQKGDFVSMETSRARGMVSSVVVPQSLGVRRKGHRYFGVEDMNSNPPRSAAAVLDQQQAGKELTEARGSVGKC